MLKLTRRLFSLRPDVHYAEFLERAYKSATTSTTIRGTNHGNCSGMEDFLQGVC